MNVYTKKQKNSWQEVVTTQKILIKIVICIALVLCLNLFQGPVRNLFFVASYPISNIFMQSGKGIHSFFVVLFNANATKNENVVLKRERESLFSEIATLRDGLKTNRDLEIALKANEGRNFKILSAKIIGINLARDSIIIDKGSEDSVKEDMPVVSNQNVAYGRVFKVHQNFSEVILISAQDSAVDVKIQSSDLAQKVIYGVLRGMGSQGVYLDLVGSELQIKEGDVLVTSGLEGLFPGNLLIGRISRVHRSDLKPFQMAEVEPFFTIKDVENLFLITGYKK